MEKPTKKRVYDVNKLNMLGKAFPTRNKGMIESIIDYGQGTWNVIANENIAKIQEFQKKPEFRKHKEKFDIMKTIKIEQKDDFKELIEAFYSDEFYIILKNYEIARKQLYKNDNKQKQTVENIMKKEYYYILSKLRWFVAWTEDVIMGKQTELMAYPGMFNEEHSKLTEKWRQLDPNSFEMYTENSTKRDRKGAKPREA
ncbi:hypothetical protein JTB14_017626 [Gonioctena quinquepunctata]|nr:hypothetical protein JTB14_017626 [Gonioctena quinquepunctata]